MKISQIEARYIYETPNSQRRLVLKVVGSKVIYMTGGRKPPFNSVAQPMTRKLFAAECDPQINASGNHDCMPMEKFLSLLTKYATLIKSHSSPTKKSVGGKKKKP